MVIDPPTCSQCGRYGHPGCLGVECFQSLPFCSTCMIGVITEYAHREDMRKREEWKRTYEEQLMVWKSRVTTALGVSATVGATLGGATATVLTSAVGLARGAVAAAHAAASSGVPEPPKAIEDTPRRPPRRSLSAGTLPKAPLALTAAFSRREGHCLACHTENRGHAPHLRSGDCVGFPGSSYYRKQSAATTKQFGDKKDPPSSADVSFNSAEEQDAGHAGASAAASGVPA
eukprot:6565637-Pyramimonas_sp.AAC.1